MTADLGRAPAYRKLHVVTCSLEVFHSTECDDPHALAEGWWAAEIGSHGGFIPSTLHGPHADRGDAVSALLGMVWL